MRTLPSPPRPTVGISSPRSHGLAVLRFIVTERVTATCSDLDLLLAHHAGPFLVASWQGDTRALETVQEARALVAGALARRQAAEVLAHLAPVSAPTDRSDGGQTVVAYRAPVPVLPDGSTDVAF